MVLITHNCNTWHDNIRSLSVVVTQFDQAKSVTAVNKTFWRRAITMKMFVTHDPLTTISKGNSLRNNVHIVLSRKHFIKIIK